MPSLTQVSVVAALAVVGLAVPLTHVQLNSNGLIAMPGFTVQRVAVTRQRAPKTLAQYRGKARRKMGLPIDPVFDVIEGLLGEKHNKATSTDGSGSVVAESIQGDLEYLSPVTIGNSTLMLDFDTGSADLWVYSSLLPTNETQGHDIYEVQANKQLGGQTWQISYGDGSGASGYVYADTVTIGGVTVSEQAVEAATDVSPQFVEDEDNDGIVGFGFSTINTVKQNGSPKPAKTWFDNIRDRLPLPVFAAALKSGNETAGVYDIGFLNQSNYQGEITYLPVNSSEGFWSVGPSPGAVLDTGTTLAYYDDAAVKAYYATIDRAVYAQTLGGWCFPCSTNFTADFPIQLGDISSVVEAQFMNFGVADTMNPDICFGAVQSSDDIGGLVLLGDTFLKGKYVVFGYDSAGAPQAGLAWQPGHGPVG